MGCFILSYTTCMPHIHTEPGQHDLTASAYVVRTDLPEPAILLHMHKTLHKWMQFGGHVELHENPWQTVIHELREESGYELSQLKLLQPDIRLPEFDTILRHPWPVSVITGKFDNLDHYHTDIAYAFTADQAPIGVTDENESGKFRLFTYKELHALANDQTLNNVRAVSLAILSDYLLTWRQVPAF